MSAPTTPNLQPGASIRTHWGAKVCPIHDWQEGLETLRSLAISADCGGPGDEFYRGGVVLRLDGEAHTRRRKAISLLLRRGGHQWFRDEILVPTAREEMARLLDGSSGRHVDIDLRAWLETVNMQLAAAFVGIDARSSEDAAILHDYVIRHLKGFPGAIGQTLKGFDPEGEAERDALAASAEFRERYYRPSYERRAELVALVEAGELDESELPHDLLTLFARRIDPAWEDEGLRVREAFFFLPAASGTTAVTTVWALGELLHWFEEHPEERELASDSAFLRRATEEALRLHPVVQALARVATDHIELPNGTTLEKGDIPTVVLGSGDIDTAVFGVDAAEFNPHRDVPAGIPPYGLAFGGGPHMCIGIPLAMGQEGIDGNVVFWLKELLAAGVELNPDQPGPPVHQLRGVHRREVESRYGTAYPVRFPARA